MQVAGGVLAGIDVAIFAIVLIALFGLLGLHLLASDRTAHFEVDSAAHISGRLGITWRAPAQEKA